MKINTRLSEYVRACFTGIWIESHEHQDALTEIAQLCHDEQWGNWQPGTSRPGLSVSGQTEQDASSNDPLAAIRAINALATPDGTAILVLQNFHRFTQSAEVVQALARQIITGKQNRTIVVVLSPVVQIPTELEKMFVVMEHDLPNRSGTRSDRPWYRYGNRRAARRLRISNGHRCSGWLDSHGSGKRL